jgi:hypothetical protein
MGLAVLGRIILGDLAVREPSWWEGRVEMGNTRYVRVNRCMV